MAHAGLLYFVLGQGIWFLCVLSMAHHRPWIGTLVTALFIGLHLWRAKDPWAEVKLIGLVAGLGGLWETLLLATGALDYPREGVLFSIFPYWLVALWAGFAAQLNQTYAWLKGHALWAALLGAIAGPLSFRAGAALGALRFVDSVRAFAFLAVAWALLLPAVVRLSQRYDGLARSAS